jgi:Response regulator containing a CheY-like receiver domain and an HTH DNA-binding domain
MTLKVLLIDDHPPLRLGIRSLIQQAYPGAEVAEAGTADDAFKAIAAEKFDLIFLDAKLPARKGEADRVEIGKETLTRIREEDGPPVVVMSGEGGNRALVEEMMGLGAATWVPKSAEAEQTLEAIRRAVSGGVWLPPEMLGRGENSPPPAAQSLSGPLPPPITHEELGITPREFEILRLALSGLTPLKISLTLNINHDNVRRYMTRLYEKFGTANQASLHAYFAKTGLTLGILKSRPPAR